MQAPAWNENGTHLRVQQLSYHDVSGCGTAPQLNQIYSILFAMAPYGVVSRLLALVQRRARAHRTCYCLYTTAI
jgi:hypothetical protein